jgi:hypothetical protein
MLGLANAWPPESANGPGCSDRRPFDGASQFARMSRGGKGSRQQNDQQTAQKKQKAEALDKAYQAGLDRIPNTTKKQDPWDNMRDAPASSSTRPK